MSARLERERRSGKISKKVTFWIDVFSLEYCNSTSILVLSLESRANLAFPFLGGHLGGSGHHFGALAGVSGALLVASREAWGSLGGLLEASWEPCGVSWGSLGSRKVFGDSWERLWAHFASPWGSLATTRVHLNVIFGVSGLLLGS